MNWQLLPPNWPGQILESAGNSSADVLTPEINTASLRKYAAWNFIFTMSQMATLRSAAFYASANAQEFKAFFNHMSILDIFLEIAEQAVVLTFMGNILICLILLLFEKLCLCNYFQSAQVTSSKFNSSAKDPDRQNRETQRESHKAKTVAKGLQDASV